MKVARITGIRIDGNLMGLRLEDTETKKSRWRHGDLRPTARALEELFGSFQAADSKLVAYELTDWGALESLMDMEPEEGA